MILSKKSKITTITLFFISISLLCVFLAGCNVIDIDNFKECQEAGNLVSDTSPRTCRTLDGKLFVEDKSDISIGENTDES